MKTPVKLSLFGLALLMIFAAAWGAGSLAGPSAPAAPHNNSDAVHSNEHETPPSAAPMVPGGLQVASDGYRLEVLNGLSTTDTEPLRFKVLGPDGNPVTSYTQAHEKDLHLVLVRRDLSGFQHMHPVLGGNGVWSVPVKVSEPGQYRVFADFRPAARQTSLILGADVAVAGDYQPRTLENPGRTTTIGQYTVTLDGDLVPGTSSKLTLTVTKAGVPVTDLEPYLGAFGHLVTLRNGDLAYLHVHPEENSSLVRPLSGSAAEAGPQIVFYAEVPSAGVYGLFLDFQHGGTVHTAQFTAATGGVTFPVTSPSGHGH